LVTLSNSIQVILFGKIRTEPAGSRHDFKPRFIWLARPTVDRLQAVDRW
jgi:hypothetical protein